MTSVYDQLNAAGRDYDYWRGLARSVRPRALCDLGCGTGMLTVLLARIHRILRPGGVLAFDMRNPRARGWEAWNPRDSRRSVTTADGPAEVWHEVTEVAGTLVRFDTTTEILGSGRRQVVSDTLRFRDEPTLRQSLARAGFGVEQVHGDWDGTSATPSSRELLVTARRLP